MKTITLTDDQFDTLFEFVDQKVESIVEKSIDYQDSEILNEWDDLLDVHTVLENTKEEYERKLRLHEDIIRFMTIKIKTFDGKQSIMVDTTNDGN